jgi:hypothetical protein
MKDEWINKERGENNFSVSMKNNPRWENIE